MTRECMKSLIEKYRENEGYIDTLLGVRTGINDVDNKSWMCKRRFGYQPSEYRVLWDIFSKYPFSEKDVLVDYGAGLGRVLFTAVIFGCKRAIGIEIDKESIEILIDNISHLNMKREIEIYEQNAETWAIHVGVTRFFFFNPFPLIAFLKILERIIEYAKHQQNECLLFFVTLSPGYMDALNRHTECQLQDIIYDNKREKRKFDIYIYRVNCNDTN